MSDPLRIVWDALEAGGYGPRGQPQDFRSICSGHPDADNPTALHIWDEGGEAKMCCHTHGCDRLDIIKPLGLSLGDLYPDDVRSPVRPRQVRRQRNTEPPLDLHGSARTMGETLAALDRLGDRWRGEIVADCPYCGLPHARLVIDRDLAPFLHCEAGCSARMFSEGLEIRLGELPCVEQVQDDFAARWTTPRTEPDA